jgi:hypothetical protein
MPPRIKPGELPKPVIQKGRFGALPLNPFTVSYLDTGYCDSIVGFRDTVETLAYKKRPSIQLQDGKKHSSLSLDGRFFNGYSDALYRGQLPEVILAAPSSEFMAEFLKDFTEYLGKILSMGFFLPKKYVVKRDPVDELIPCTILAGGGLLFSRFMTGLVQALKSMESDYPVLDEAMRLKIVGRFVRGLLGSDAETRLVELGLSSQPGRVMPRIAVPDRIRIAGGNPQAQAIIQSVACLHGLVVIVENQARNAVERLEFEDALWRISAVIVPALAARKLLSASEAKTMAVRAEQSIMMIGQCRQAFEDTEHSEAILGVRSGWKPKTGTRKTGAAKKASEPDTRLSKEDLAVLSGLEYYAQVLGLNDEQTLFEQLASKVGSCCNA